MKIRTLFLGLLFFSAVAALTDEIPSVFLADGTEIKPVINRQYLSQCLKLIKSAQKSIYISHFTFNSDGTTDKIKEELYRAAGRGVKIKMLLEDSVDRNQSSVNYFPGWGIAAKLDSPKKFLHTKMIVVDGEKVLLGSTNLTYRAIDDNNETNILIRNPKVAGYLEKYFFQLWDDSSREIEMPLFSLAHIAVAVDRNYFPELKKTISRARRRILAVGYGWRYYPDYPDSPPNLIYEALIERSRNKVPVKVLLEKSNYEEYLSKINRELADYLSAQGIEVRFDTPEVITHSKLIVIDDDVFVGSANMAYGGLCLYHEANIHLVNLPEIADFFARCFDNLWQGEKFFLKE